MVRCCNELHDGTRYGEVPERTGWTCPQVKPKIFLEREARAGDFSMFTAA